MKFHWFWMGFISIVCFLSAAFAVGSESEGVDPDKNHPSDTQWDISQPNYSVKPKQVELELTEGTWMNIDVTPDGKSVLFDLLGDIYRIPIEGGSASEITSGHAWDMQPQVSSDGRYLSFTSDRSGADNIWIKDLLNLDEPAQQITFEKFRLLNNASWHPTQNFLVAKKHFTTSRSLGTGEIWMYHGFLDARLNRDKVSGSVVVERPAKTYQKELGEPVFAPDGESVFYTQNATAGNTFIYHEDSNASKYSGKLSQFQGIPAAKALPGISSTPSINCTKTSLSSGLQGAKPTPQFPTTTVVVPKLEDGLRCESQAA